jgi:hypothetical protein
MGLGEAKLWAFNWKTMLIQRLSQSLGVPNHLFSIFSKNPIANGIAII